MSAVTYVYLNPIEDTADEDGHAQLKFLAEDFGMTPIKVRKMFITSGVYQTATSIKVNKLYTSGKSIREIQVAGAFACIQQCYLPYRKTAYNLEESTRVAERLRKFRKRRKAAEQIEYSAHVEHQGSFKLNTRTCGIFSFIKNGRVSIDSN